MFFTEIVWTQELIYILRLIIAGICGVAIGFERKNRSKEAGVRTHFVVACGAALMMLVSKYGFFDIEAIPGLKGADGSRIASQVVNGIGFLGAGMIFVHKGTISGLTTAAGVWATAGIGMAIGSGMYMVGISATLIILLAQYLLHKNVKTVSVPKVKAIVISDVNDDNYQNTAMEILKGYEILITDIYVAKYNDTNTFDYKFIAEIPESLNETEILKSFEYSCAIRDINAC